MFHINVVMFSCIDWLRNRSPYSEVIQNEILITLLLNMRNVQKLTNGSRLFIEIRSYWFKARFTRLLCLYRVLCSILLLLLLYFGTFPETWFWWYKASCVVLTGAFLLWSHRFDTFYDCAKKSNKVRIGIFRRQKNYTLFLLIISSGNEFYC